MPGNAIVAATEEMLMIAPPLPAGAVGTHRAQAVLEAERGAEDVDLEHRADVVRVDLGDQAGDLDAGVVDQDVEPAELVDGGGDGVLPARRRRSRRGARSRGPLARAPSATFSPRSSCRSRDDDAAPAAASAWAIPSPSPCAPTGDQGLAAGQVEIGHGQLLCRWCCGRGHTMPRALDECQDFAGHLSRISGQLSRDRRLPP